MDTPPPPPPTQVINLNGESMCPTLCDGAKVVIAKIDFKDIQRGQIVWFSQPKRNIVHRAHYKSVFGVWTTKGDNNPKSDIYGCSKRNFLGAVVDAKHRGTCTNPKRK